MKDEHKLGAAKGGCLNAFLSAGFGIWLGIALVFIGSVCCLTVIGAIVGIPLILAGLSVPVLSFFLGGAVGVGLNATEKDKERLNSVGHLPDWIPLALLIGCLVFLGWLAWTLRT